MSRSMKNRGAIALVQATSGARVERSIAVICLLECESHRLRRMPDNGSLGVLEAGRLLGPSVTTDAPPLEPQTQLPVLLCEKLGKLRDDPELFRTDRSGK
jgi:hypothetical protein